MIGMQLQKFAKILGLAVGVGLAFAPGEAAAKAGAICPQYLMKYCVIIHGHRETTWTNPCFARLQHIRILHLGACKH